MTAGSEGDPQYQLPPKVVRQYAEFRRAKGQVEYNNGSILSTDLQTLDKLRNIDLIDDSQLWAGINLIQLRNIAFSELDYHRTREIILDRQGTRARLKLGPLAAFTVIVQSLNLGQWHLVKRICWETVRPNDWGWIIQCHRSVQDALDAVARKLDELMESDENEAPPVVDA